MTSLREIKLLRELSCPYIVRLLDVFPRKRQVNMVGHVLYQTTGACSCLFPTQPCGLLQPTVQALAKAACCAICAYIPTATCRCLST